jgi:CheY-like chemotaxis protein
MTHGSGNVLWVDDEAEATLRHLGRSLVRRGVFLTRALDYDTAVKRLRESKFDAFLLDVILPGGLGESSLGPYGGIRLASEIRALEHQEGVDEPAPIVILSVLPRKDLEESIRELDLVYFDKLELLNTGVLERIVEILKGRISSVEHNAEADG